MITKDTINFRVGLNDETISPKFYWDMKWINVWVNGSSALNRGILLLNGFDNPEYTDVLKTFGWKLHGVALAIASFINSYHCDDLDILAKDDIEREPAWKAFKKIVADIMVKHKIGKGIKIGGYAESFIGACKIYNWEPVSKIGKMLDEGELVKAGHANFESGICGVLLNITEDGEIVLNEKYIREILERPKYTIAFINERREY